MYSSSTITTAPNLSKPAIKLFFINQRDIERKPPRTQTEKYIDNFFFTWIKISPYRKIGSLYKSMMWMIWVRLWVSGDFFVYVWKCFEMMKTWRVIFWILKEFLYPSDLLGLEYFVGLKTYHTNPHQSQCRPYSFICLFVIILNYCMNFEWTIRQTKPKTTLANKTRYLLCFYWVWVWEFDEKQSIKCTIIHHQTTPIYISLMFKWSDSSSYRNI